MSCAQPRCSRKSCWTSCCCAKIALNQEQLRSHNALPSTPSWLQSFFATTAQDAQAQSKQLWKRATQTLGVVSLHNLCEANGKNSCWQWFFTIWRKNTTTCWQKITKQRNFSVGLNELTWIMLCVLFRCQANSQNHCQTERSSASNCTYGFQTNTSSSSWRQSLARKYL